MFAFYFLQLSDVAAGGGTVFTDLGLTVNPVKVTTSRSSKVKARLNTTPFKHLLINTFVPKCDLVRASGSKVEHKIFWPHFSYVILCNVDLTMPIAGKYVYSYTHMQHERDNTSDRAESIWKSWWRHHMETYFCVTGLTKLWRFHGALTFSLISAHYDVTVMVVCWIKLGIYLVKMFKNYCMYMIRFSLRWRHNGRDGVSNHQPHDCLLNRLFGRRSKQPSKLRVTGLCVGNSPGTGEIPRTHGQ